MTKSVIAVLITLFSTNAAAELVEEQTLAVETKITIVRLSVMAKCQSPRFEDDGYTVRYTPESYREVESYRGYSSELSGRTCGKRGSATELSSKNFEKVEVILYNYGEAKSDFDAQVRELIKAL